ncbi:MAG: STAS domain-containing protein [Syntrophorhabdus sp.]
MLEHHTEKIFASFQGNATIAETQEMRDTLIQALESGKPVIIDLGDVVQCDLSLFQLICAAHKKCLADGLPITLGSCSIGVMQAMQDIGLFRSSGCRTAQGQPCLWNRKEDTGLTP